MSTEKTVADLIPHRPPFLFVDKVIERFEDGLIAERAWKLEDNAFYEGHYPENPITPGVILCESVFQTAAVYISEKLHAQEGGVDANYTPVLSRILDARFKQMVKPGDVVQIEVRDVEKKHIFNFMKGKITKDGKTVMSVEFAVAMIDESKHEQK